jgi:hypothetical protein
VRGFAVGVLVGAAAVTVVGMAMTRPPLPTVESTSYNVRMLDLTVTGLVDKNTTNRRQRFECLPVKEKR